MFYSITNLCPRTDIQMCRHGFTIKLFEEWQDMVAARKHTQKRVNQAIESMGRIWLDACGFGLVFDPDNCGIDAVPNRAPGPDARPAYMPNRDLRVTWGDWGLEHITVPGNACGLDLDRGLGAPKGGRVLLSHNVDSLNQKLLLLVVFCWFAEDLATYWEVEGKKPVK